MKVPGTFVALPPTQQTIPPHVWLMAAAIMRKQQQEEQENDNAPTTMAQNKGESGNGKEK